jgi:hypothetical protein
VYQCNLPGGQRGTQSTIGSEARTDAVFLTILLASEPLLPYRELIVCGALPVASTMPWFRGEFPAHVANGARHAVEVASWKFKHGTYMNALERTERAKIALLLPACAAIEDHVLRGIICVQN